MLLRFSVANYKSYKNREVFSMVAGKHTKHPSHVIDCNGRRVLKGSFIFGANASGKSNLFEAIAFARQIVLGGLKAVSLVGKHFRIDDKCLEQPGVFQFDIYTNGHFYSYGFALSYKNALIEEEWLYLCDNSEKVIFERKNIHGESVTNSELAVTNEIYNTYKVFADNVPPDKLLLREIADRKVGFEKELFPFQDVMNWMRNLIVIMPYSRYEKKEQFFAGDKNENSLGDLFKDFDTGIEKIELEEAIAEEALKFLPQENRENVLGDLDKIFRSNGKTPVTSVDGNVDGHYFSFKMKNNQIYASRLKMNHGNVKDMFELLDESDGTQRLFDLIPVYDAGRNDKVILVDELDRSFHTVLVKAFIEGYYRTTENVYSQLIASVHDSNVMDLDLLRQDEIWFVERQEDHSSHLYSLNKFKERFDKKVVRDYLIGRYGAIPCITQVGFEDKENE